MGAALSHDQTSRTSSAVSYEGFDVIERLWFGDTGLDNFAEAAAARSMAARAAEVAGAYTFPHAALDVARRSRNADVTVGELTELIEQDVGLASRVLQLVNSAAFSLRVQCTSIGHAVSLIGTRTVGELAMAAAALRIYDSIPGELGSALSRHAVTVASIARELAGELGLSTDLVYTCALMHDIGKVLMLIEPEYKELLREAVPQADGLHLRERTRFGYDHAVLGGHVLEHWGLPQPIATVVAWHHQPARAFEEGGDVGRLVSLTRLANKLAYAVADGDVSDERELAETLARDEAATYLGLDADALQAHLGDIEALALGKHVVDEGSAATRHDRCATCGEPGLRVCKGCGAHYCKSHLGDEHSTCWACRTSKQGQRSGKVTALFIAAGVAAAALLFAIVAMAL
ncbi:MAG: HDOD domain-containing protein [Myxococcales bacterium]|nr:HDOD domain-containing protein [Myxococcales bacterium]